MNKFLTFIAVVAVGVSCFFIGSKFPTSTPDQIVVTKSDTTIVTVRDTVWQTVERVITRTHTVRDTVRYAYNMSTGVTMFADTIDHKSDSGSFNAVITDQWVVRAVGGEYRPRLLERTYDLALHCPIITVGQNTTITNQVETTTFVPKKANYLAVGVSYQWSAGQSAFLVDFRRFKGMFFYGVYLGITQPSKVSEIAQKGPLFGCSVGLQFDLNK